MTSQLLAAGRAGAQWGSFYGRFGTILETSTLVLFHYFACIFILGIDNQNELCIM